MNKQLILNGKITEYKINELGQIFNKKGQELYGTITKHGYVKMTFSINSEKIGKYKHRVVAENFLNFNEADNLIINHIDGNKLNNAVSNLEILSSSDNLIHAYSHNLRGTNLNKRCIIYNGDLPDEEWKFIDGYNNKYQISNMGRVKSFSYTIPILLRQDIRCGYKSVVLSLNGKTKHFTVHELVYFTFTNQSKELGKVIDHIDGDKFNNCLSNLRYISIQDNLNASLYEQKTHNNCKPVIAKKNGIYIGQYDSIALASRILNIDSSAISKICKGKQKTAHGYTFEYLE